MPDQPESTRDWAQEVRTRLSSLKLSPTREREIVEELSQHLDDRWHELIAGGASSDEATRLTLAQFRGADVLANDMAPLRQAHAPAPITPGAPSRHVLAGLPHNLRYAARILWKQPGFAAVAVLTIALGIGATTAIFSVVYGVLLKPLPFDEPDRLVALYHVTPATPRDFQGDATYFTYREHGRVFDDIGLWTTGDVSVVRNGAPEQVLALRVTDGTLSLLGVRAALGRLIQKEDDVPAAPLRVVLTHAYWQETFGASNDVIGQSLVMNARPHEIIGVLPASFKLLNTDPQVVLPLRLNPANTRTGPLFLGGIARLKPGVTLAQANDDIARMIPLIVKKFPLMPGLTQEMWDSVRLAPNVRPLSEAVIGEMSRPLWILLGTVGIVLLMAWTNVANLLLVRAEGRQREFAIRGALGASRGRITAELLSESLILGLAGGTLGVLFAEAGIGLLRRMAPAALPRVDDIGIDGVVLVVTLTISVVTALIFGLLPAVKLGTLTFLSLKDAGRSVSDSPGRHRTRNTLVVAQVALAMVLLVVSGLMARTFIAMRQTHPGFVRPGEVQTFDLALPAALIRDRQQVTQTFEQIAERLKQVPSVKAVGLGSIRMDGVAGKAPIYVEGRPVSGLPPTRSIKSIGPGYFETMGNPVLVGRAIEWTDIFQFKPVVLISENLAREHWDSPAKAVGQRIGMFPKGPWQEIVGVVGNVRADGLNQPAPALVYFPMADADSVSRNMTYAVRSDRAGTLGLLRELQQAVWSLNANVPLANVRTLDRIQAESMSQISFAMVMLAIAASVALLLGVGGIYGVIRYIAAQRTREIGIRMALGAQAGDVRRLFLRHGVVLTLAGIGFGIGAATLLTRIMSALLFGVGPMDPVTYVAASAGLAAVAALATYLPAHRASAIDPVVALRSDI
jgi:putative ABC transport system permease protein